MMVVLFLAVVLSSNADFILPNVVWLVLFIVIVIDGTLSPKRLKKKLVLALVMSQLLMLSDEILLHPWNILFILVTPEVLKLLRSSDVKPEQPENMLLMFVAAVVTKLLTSMDEIFLMLANILEKIVTDDVSKLLIFKLVKGRPLNMPPMFVAAVVTKLLTSNDVKLLQNANMPLKFDTFDVSKLLIFNDVNPVHLSNIEDMFVTMLVLKLLKSKEVKPEHCWNILLMFCTLFVFNSLKLISVIFDELKNI